MACQAFIRHAWGGRGASATLALRAPKGFELGFKRRPISAVFGLFGAGFVIALGTFAGLGYSRGRHEGLEAFARGAAVLAGVAPALTVSPPDGELLQWRSRLSGRSRLLFVTADTSIDHVLVSGGRELLGDQKVWSLAEGSAGVPRYSADRFEFDVALSEDGIAVLAWGDPHA